MTPEEFRTLLAESSDQEIVQLCFDQADIPYVFDGNATAWDRFRDEISATGVSANDVRVVGSGRFGFSLKPNNNLRIFQDTSDIDVLVVSSAQFDELWLAILRAAYPRPPVTVDQSMRERQKSVYTGWLSPLDVAFDTRLDGSQTRPALQIKAAWFEATKRAASTAIRRHEDISGRLYRSWEHAALYHEKSISDLRQSLLRP